MDSHLKLLTAMWLLTAMLLAGCSGRAANDSNKLQITVSIVPQKYFVERIGGEHVEVNVMVRPGDNPATYEPKPEQLKALSRADAYISIGVPFENAWLDRIRLANGKMMIVDTTQSIQRIPLEVHHHREDEKDTRAESQNAQGHTAETLDPHIWLSPKLVKIQAETIYRALAKLDAKNEEIYKANLDVFLADIDALIEDSRKTLTGVPNRKFMVFHPSWGYFARDFDLEMIAIEVGGQEPSAAELAALIAEVKKEGIKVIFAQPEFSTRAAETIAKEIGGKVLLISPLALDWPANLRQAARTFADALSE